MGNYPAHPAYQDSGVPWLGEIPAHWEVKLLKRVAMIQPSNVDKKSEEGELPVLLCNYTDVYNNEEITAAIDFMQATATPQEIEKFRIVRGDVIVTKDSESPHDIAVPAYVAEDFENTLCGYHLTQIRSTELDGKFLFRLFQSSRFNAQFVVGANGVTRFGLPQRVINDAPVAFPPLAEQQAIARFLEAKTAQIDALIAKQAALLALLAERRSALITHAVTRGLDPAAPRRASGIPWLGDIPAHWRVDLIKRFYRVELGKMLNRSMETNGTVTKPYLRAANIHWGRILLDDVNEMEFTPAQLQRYRLEPGDLLVTEGGVTVGRSAIWHGELDECYYQNSINRVRPQSDDATSSFLFYWMHFTTNSGLVELTANTATFGHLTQEKLQAFPVAFPPLAEQQAIAGFLDAKLQAIDAQTAQVHALIAALREYRAALITHAVTGQIDVRGLPLPPAPLPEPTHAQGS